MNYNIVYLMLLPNEYKKEVWTKIEQEEKISVVILGSDSLLRSKNGAHFKD